VNEIGSLLEQVRDVAGQACSLLHREEGRPGKEDVRSGWSGRELKTDSDVRMEEFLVDALSNLGLPILTEERGEIGRQDGTARRIVVDPLDGTVNYVRGLGPSAVSIAVCDGMIPLCGAVAVYPACDVAWGGRSLGAYINDVVLNVSEIGDAGQGVLCTGFPARFSLDDEKAVAKYVAGWKQYAKVRMLGAASVSLLQVAKGAAEAYAENDIMLWDVAAGLALVEGAGGAIEVAAGRTKNSLNVRASNGRVRAPAIF